MNVGAAAAMGPPVGMRVRLSSNESPFGPSPRALDAAQKALTEAHRYSDDQARALRERLADDAGVSLGQVAVANGSAAALMEAITYACVGHDDAEVLAFARSFVVYRLAAQNVGARYIEVPGTPSDTPHAPEHRDVDALLAAITPHTRVIAIDNPGNPTGSHITADELSRLISAVPPHIMLIVDEAYHHFADGLDGYQRVSSLAATHPRLVTAHTFSKAYALAGMRIGVLYGSEHVIGEIDARRPRFNVTAPAQAAALASLDDDAHLAMTVKESIAGRERLAAGLLALNVAFTEGLGNFVSVDFGTAADPVIDAYAAKGVGIRTLVPYGMPHAARVSVGTSDEVDAFLQVTKELAGTFR